MKYVCAIGQNYFTLPSGKISFSGNHALMELLNSFRIPSSKQINHEHEHLQRFFKADFETRPPGNQITAFCCTFQEGLHPLLNNFWWQFPDKLSEVTNR